MIRVVVVGDRVVVVGAGVVVVADCSCSSW